MADAALMSNASAAVETEEEQVSRISAAVARAKVALEEVKAKVLEYDSQYKASETASGYLLPPIQKAQAAFDELTATASSLKDKTVEFPTKALSRTLSAANGALEQIADLSRQYDEKFQLSATVQKAVSVPREKCQQALVEVSNRAASVSASANAQLQGVNHGICSRVVGLAATGAGVLFSTAAALENRYDIETKAVGAGTKVLGKASEYDEKYSVRERVGSLTTATLGKAQGLDSRVTGGKLTPVVLSAYEKGLAMATDGLEYVKTGYQAAKEERQGDAPAAKTEVEAEVGNATEATEKKDGYEAAAAPEAAPEAAAAAEAPVAAEAEA